MYRVCENIDLFTVHSALLWLLLTLPKRVGPTCSETLDRFVPPQIRETGGYRLHCFEPQSKEEQTECYLHFVMKMNFEKGVEACHSVGGRIITIRDSEHGKRISDWVEYSFYINVHRISPESEYFYYNIYPPKYTNIACDTSVLGRDCMIVRTNGLWCTAVCSEKHSIVCEFDDYT